jgi:hypothetical protein
MLFFSDRTNKRLVRFSDYMSRLCDTSIIDQLSFHMPALPCQTPFLPSAWLEFKAQLQQALLDPSYVQIIVQCLCANRDSCENNTQACAGLQQNPMQLYLKPQCMNCVFSGPCAKFQPEMAKLACVLMNFSQYRENMSTPEKIEAVARLLYSCCGIQADPHAVGANDAQQIAGMLDALSKSLEANKTTAGDTGSSASADDSSSSDSTKKKWILIGVGALVLVIAVLVILAVWLKPGQLSRLRGKTAVRARTASRSLRR